MLKTQVFGVPVNTETRESWKPGSTAVAVAKPRALTEIKVNGIWYRAPRKGGYHGVAAFLAAIRDGGMRELAGGCGCTGE